jgi:hypothetical protein
MLLLAAALAAPAAGGGGVAVITNAVGGSFVQEGPAGLFPAECGEVGVELVPDPLPVPWFWMTSFEFPVITIPAGSAISSATIGVIDADAASPDPIQIYGYNGDGAITTADFSAQGVPVVYVPEASPSRQSIDVTSLVGASALASGWAGFQFVAQTEDFSTVHHSLSCPDDEEVPTLVITYEMTALPDTATAVGAGGGVGIWIAFGVLILSVLAALAWRRTSGRQSTLV